ncbi:hypothetical protein HJFPF1_05537 [Paramyrothecium foliicola]|nr:hypothetical protein HJFPF1_05537 [Paramyrothecium foliicola]
MSGLEVVGVVLAVLGALPAAVKALEGYRNLFSSKKYVERDLTILIRDLTTEHVRLRTTCEKLLDGIAPFTVIDDLIEKPFGPDWEPYKHRLKLRLWSSQTRFEEQLFAMQEAAAELARKLGVQKNGKTNPGDKHTIISELKRRSMFTLKKKDYENVLERIKSGNSVLFELANRGWDMQPSRQRRSQARLTKIVRGLTSSLYHAISTATTCHCAQSHTVCLEVVPRNTVIVSSDDEDRVAEDLIFNVAFGTNRYLPTDDPDTVFGLNEQSYWDNFDLRLNNAKPSSAASSVETTPAINSRIRTQKKVAWSTPFVPRMTKPAIESTTQTVVDISRTLVSMPNMTAHAQSLISDLCHDLLKKGKRTALNCSGYITDSKNKFGLYQRQGQGSYSGTTTLRELLKSIEQGSLDDFTCANRIKVALAIAISVLHLYKTPWIRRSVTLDDFIFLKEDPGHLLGPDTIEWPFVSRSITDNAGKQANKQVRPGNLTLLSLGAILTQVIIGQTVDELEMVGGTALDMRAMLWTRKAALELSDEVLVNGGPNYAAVVGWCLENVCSLNCLEDEVFCDTFYNKVVVRLEEDVNMLSQASAW